MVMVRLKGVHSVRVRLATGRVETYHYAWKGAGAPRLTGAPGSPAFIASYQEAHRARTAPLAGSLAFLVASFKASADFTRLGRHTQRAYRRHLDQIQTRFGSMPLSALADPGVRRHFLAWRDAMAATPRTADYAVTTAKRLAAWAKERGYIGRNELADIGRLHRADRSDCIWTAVDLAAFADRASPELRWAVALAAHTGLRQSDLIALAWSHYDGQSFQMRTSKRGLTVLIPATAPCRALIETIPRRSPVVLTTARDHQPWTADGLRSSFRKACKAAGVQRTFHDLRRTAATNLLLAGHAAPQVAMVMGWAEDAVDALKLRYVSRAAVVASMLASAGEAG